MYKNASKLMNGARVRPLDLSEQETALYLLCMTQYTPINGRSYRKDRL